MSYRILILKMKKSSKSVVINPDWLTELTDAEMESTTGGLLTTQQFNNWWDAQKAGSLNYISVLNTLQRESSNGDAGADLKIFQRWFIRLPREDKKLVLSTIADFVKDYLRT